jgi:hypothetical protein
MVGIRVQCWDMRIQGLQNRVSWAYSAPILERPVPLMYHESGISLIAPMKLWSTCINVAQWTVMNNDC